MSNFKGPSFLSKIVEPPTAYTLPTKELTIPVTRSKYSRYDKKYDEYDVIEEDEEPEPEPQTKPKT